MKGIKLFIYSAGAILLAAALERLLVAAGQVPVQAWAAAVQPELLPAGRPGE